MTQATVQAVAAGALGSRKPRIASIVSPRILLAVGFVVLVAVSIATALFIDRTRSDSAWVAHTLEVQYKLSKLELQLRRSESALRGYLLTDDPEFLNRYRTDAEALGPSIDDLEKAVSDNPRQLDLLGELRGEIDKIVGGFGDILRLRDSGDSAAVAALVRKGTRAAPAQDLISGMEAEERRLFALRTADSDRSGRWVLALAVLGAAIIIGLAAASLAQMQRSTRELTAAHRDLTEINMNLEALANQRSGYLREANEEIQRFAYIVSHDLRSPLVNIMGFTSELETVRKSIFDRIAGLRAELGGNGEEQDRSLEGDFDESLAFIKSSIGKMDRLINAILKLSREGQRKLQPAVIDMSALMQSIADTVATQTREAGATITVERLANVTSDRLALEQVFSNLIDNAVKYLRSDAPGRIEITATETPTEVIYVIRDNGRGIDPKDQERIFDLFRRSGAQDRPGEGVGLAHTRALVRRVGGSISVVSTLGQGSEFRVALPKIWTPRKDRTAA